MNWSLCVLVMAIVLHSGCEDADLREQQNRSAEDGAEIPDFDSEKIKSVKASESVTVKVANTALTIPQGALAEDAEVRMRILKNKPERQAIAELGESKGDVIELTIYHKQTEEVFASNVLSEPYIIRQSLGDVNNLSDIKYVAISLPGTKDESIDVVGGSAVSSPTALLSTEIVSVSFSITHVIFYAVESAKVPASVVVINDTSGLSNDGGNAASNGSTNGGASSAGDTIDCSALAGGKWIAVPKNEAVGQWQEFCVMKYEAKIQGNDNGSSSTDAASMPESRSSGTPWVTITRNEARDVCKRLNLIDSNVQGYTLITNSMWQTIARNIETAALGSHYLNWRFGSSTNIFDAINYGNASSAGENPLVASDDDREGCIGIPYPENPPSNFDPPPINCGEWSIYKRTHSLSNGEIIWDLSGNIFEFVYDDNETEQGEDIAMSKISAAAGYDMNKWGPIGDHVNKVSDGFRDWRAGLGLGTLNYAQGAILRGGYVRSSSNAGIYTVNLNINHSLSNVYWGFRCAYAEN